MKYRSRTEIMALVLEAANGGTTKMKLMYKAFLSYAQLKEYLAALIATGMLEHDSPFHIYRTTNKGLRFIALCDDLDRVAGGVRNP
jgi:predicted transcriptional regulator